MTSPFKILVLEDDPGMREALGEVLTDEGYLVTLTQRGDDAIAQAAREDFDLVISDIKMPGMDGLQAVEQVRQHQPAIKTMIVTGYSTEAHAMHACRLGVSDYLEKPFRLDDLLERVRLILGEKRKEQERHEQTDEWRRASLSCLRTVASLLDRGSGRLLGAGRLAARLAGSEETLSVQAEIVTLMAGCQRLAPELPAPDFGDAIAEFAKAVEERWDGSGPGQLAGKEIPFLSRVARLALFHERKELEVTHFDPDLLAQLQRRPEVNTPSTESRSRSRSLLSLGRTMEMADDLETAHQSYTEIIEEHPGTREESEARLGLTRIARLSGSLTELAKLSREAEMASQALGPAAHASNVLELGLLLNTEEPELALELIAKAQDLRRELRDQVGTAQATLALSWVDRHWNEQCGEALSLLQDSIHQEAFSLCADWLVPLMLREKHPSTTKVLKACPTALAGNLQRGSLDSEAKSTLLELLRGANTSGQRSLLQALAQDRDPSIREEARLLLKLDAPLQTSVLRIYLFGVFEAFSGARKLAEARWKRKKIRNLLAYLAVNWRKPVTEDRVLEEFWPGPLGRAKRSLYQATWELRRSLRLADQPEFDYVERNGGSFCLNRNLPLWIDFEQFERAYEEARDLEKRGNSEEAIPHYARTVQLGRGPFLEDCYLDWAVAARDSSSRRLLTAHDRLARNALEQGNAMVCQEHANQLLELDRFHQPGHLLAMEASLILGHPEKAIRQFEECEKLLRKELNVEPTAELLDALGRAQGKG